MHASRPRSLVLTAAGLLWAASLLLPALSVSGGPMFTGLELLMRGWQGASRGVFAWYANPLFVAAIGLAFVHRDRAAAVTSGLAVALALTSFALEDAARARVSSMPELVLHSGFYVWIAALAAFFLWSSTAAWRRRRAFSQSP